MVKTVCNDAICICSYKDETESDIIDENLIEERLSQLLTTKLPPNQPIQDSTIHSDKVISQLH